MSGGGPCPMLFKIQEASRYLLFISRAMKICMACPTIPGRAQLANHMQFFQTCKLTHVITTNPFRYFEDGGAQSVSDQHLPNKNHNRCKLKTSVGIHIALRNPGGIPPSTSHAGNDGSDGQCPPTMVFSSLVAVQVVISLLTTHS